MPPTAHNLSTRLLLGPALRAQSDRRLVDLVRDGHESAFEEIVRRYRRPLDRFAASIVGAHADDVTQDSFRKALEALRTVEADVELRPWLFRIVRNTALNDLRDRPPAAAELAEDLVAGGRSAAIEAEQRAELQDLTAQLRALPENQRAALVMRELEGMSHEEIAAALGISDGAARQAIARARAAIRSGFGALVPLPLLRALASGGDQVAGAAAGAGGGAAVAAGGGAIAAGSGGIGAGALKVGLATVVAAGTLGAGVAIERHGGGHGSDGPPGIASAPHGVRGAGARKAPSSSSSPAPIERDEGAAAAGHDGRGAGDASRHHNRRHGGREERGGSGPRIVPVAQQTTVAAPESDGHPGAGADPGPSRHAGSDGGGGGDPHQAPSGDGHQGSRDDGSGDGGGSRDVGGSTGGDSGHGSFDDGGSHMSGSSGGGDGGGGAVEAAPTQTSGTEDGGSLSDGGDSGTSGGDGAYSGTESTVPIEAHPQSVGETVPPAGTEPSP
ncbi:MAG TPA: sigma-70 family RNA polymerase sigma factor [Solirubrobacterales bacterium]|nr:sigma-70 family RNA polymerase sigma factor [Solirubrobacterales bacterium]